MSETEGSGPVDRDVRPQGLESVIGDGRRVVAFPCADGNFAFLFFNGEVETRIRLSPEAVDAMAAICLEFRCKGLVA